MNVFRYFPNAVTCFYRNIVNAFKTIKSQIIEKSGSITNPPSTAAHPAESSLLINPKFLTMGLLLIGSLVLIPGIGSKRPLEDHEAYVPLVASEMLRSGNFIVPYFNGKPRLEKPPLSYWLVAGLHAMKGKFINKPISEWEARFPSFIAGIILLLVTINLGRAAFGDTRIGFVAAAVLVTSQGFFKYGHNARPEMLYTLFCTLQMLGIFHLLCSHESKSETVLASLMTWCGFVGAVLAKGPLVPIIFLTSTVLGLFILGFRPSWRIWHQLGIGLITIIAVGIYFLYLSQHIKGANELWMHEIFQSSSIPFWSRPCQNGFYFPKVVIRLSRPWLLFLPTLVFALRHNRKLETMILGLTIVMLICSLTFSGKMREHYVLPVLPIIFVLIGRGCIYVWDQSVDSPAWGIGFSLLVGVYVLFFAIGIIVLGIRAFHIEPIKNIDPVFQVLIFLAGAFLALIWTLQNLWQQPRVAFASLALAAALLYAGMGIGAFDWKSEYYSIAKFGKSIATHTRENQPVVIETSNNVPSILFYCNCQMQRFHFSELDKLMRDYPDALIITEERRIERAGVTGEIVLQEHRTKEKHKRLVLFKPDGRNL